MEKKVLNGCLNESENNRNNFLISLFFAILALTLYIFSGVKYNKVFADENDGLMNNYTLYSLEANEEAMDIIEGEYLTLTIDETNFSGLINCYFLTTKFVLADVSEIVMSSSLSVSIYVDNNGISTDGLDMAYDYVDFYFTQMRNAKAIMVPNQYTNAFDNLLELYTYGNDNPVYPLSDLIKKVTESSEQYLLLDSIIPFNEILHLGTNWYIYYYGTWNKGYEEGLEDGYNNALELQDNELSYMGRFINVMVHGFRSIMNQKILGELTIGNFFFVPVFIGVLILLWKMIGRGG